MNYFELFEIPVQLRVDKTTLTQKYFELSRKYHPDYFVNSTNEEKAVALEKSALLNEAYRTLQKPDETIQYVLKLKGLLEDEEKYDLPPSFLMQIMELNEALMDSDNEKDKEKLFMIIDKLEKEIYEPVQKIVEEYKDGVNSCTDLLQVKEYYFKKKYIERIRRQLQGK